MAVDARRIYQVHSKISKRAKSKLSRNVHPSLIDFEKGGYFFSTKWRHDVPYPKEFSDAFEHDDVEELNRVLDKLSLSEKTDPQHKLERRWPSNDNSLLHDAAYFDSPKIFLYLCRGLSKKQIDQKLHHLNDKSQKPKDIAYKYSSHKVFRIITQGVDHLLQKEEQIKQQIAKKKATFD